MKQIKTLVSNTATGFDLIVNEALSEGWELTKRETLVLDRQPAFYAELEREEITEAERCCANCAHWNKASDQQPCCDCTDQADKWELGK